MTLNGNHSRDEKRLEAIEAVVHEGNNAPDPLLNALRDARPQPRPGHRAELERALFTELALARHENEPDQYDEPAVLMLPPKRSLARRLRIVPVTAAAAWVAAMFGIGLLVAQTNNSIDLTQYGAQRATEEPAAVASATPSPMPTLFPPTATPIPAGPIVISEGTVPPDSAPVTDLNATATPFPMSMPTAVAPSLMPGCAQVEADDTLESFSIRYGTVPLDVIQLNPGLVTITYAENTASYTLSLSPESCLVVNQPIAPAMVEMLTPAERLIPLDDSQPALQAGQRLAIYARIERVGADEGALVDTLVTAQAVVTDMRDSGEGLLISVPSGDALVLNWLIGSSDEAAPALYYEVLGAE
ncbi:MAG: hypothetical protein KME04_20275 [Pleurocapsa minor GSE-CHR-MK-17-07R]|jgi:hypothetical protein|nr:hypothetical protein [Pleurocapsa minor GSE-CHR-MK 17-07R]